MHKLLLSFCLISVFNNIVVLADPPYWHCPDASSNNTTSKSLFQQNVDSLLSLLSSNASRSKFDTISAGNGNMTVYGLFLCYDYVTLESCRTSIFMASQAVRRRCNNSTDVTVWEEVSQLHISNQRFFGKLNVTGNINKYNVKVAPEPEKFRSVINTSLYDVARMAAFDSSTRMYATQSVAFLDSQRVYSLVQCTPDLSPNDCFRCLQKAIGDVLDSDNYRYRGGRLLSKSCYLRYEFYAFYDGKSSEEPAGQDKQWKTRILPIGLAFIFAVLVGSCVLFFVLRDKFQGKDFQEMDSLFDLASIQAATDNFSEKHKLGEGGFGPVFKGDLKDGTKVAVKRLSNKSDQGTEEFTNEVLLIMKLQHKNLVKLLGFCVEGAERLLVYELMCSGDLDSWLYDPQKCAQMTWSKRLDIINGIANGVLYLHEDSRLRIIHRDLKPGNVLLDSDLNPKISDFGNARIYGTENEASTVNVIGTYGYMAPEYAMEGLYSVKSDVFSFGIILLEIITGRKSFKFHLTGNGPSLQAFAWRLWNEGKWKELMEPQLKSYDSCEVTNEFLRCLHIGLLCVQEDPSERPTMSFVVHMLKHDNVNIHPPKKPAFTVGRFGNHYETSPVMSNSIRCFDLSDLSAR